MSQVGSGGHLDRRGDQDSGRGGNGWRDPARVPANWAQLLDPSEWHLNSEGLPARRAARVLVLRSRPRPQILLVAGHDAADASHRWLFTPGGGIEPGEEPAQAAVRELAEESGLVVSPAQLIGPVARRLALFEFTLVTARQEEEIFALVDPPAAGVDTTRWTAHEREVLDGLSWWDLETVEQAVRAGTQVFPTAVVTLAWAVLRGWDGKVRHLGL